MLQLIPGGFLKAIAEDTSPELSANLDGGGYNISNVGAGTLASLVVDTDTLVVDSANHRVGVGSVNPKAGFHVVGDGADVHASSIPTGTTAFFSKSDNSAVVSVLTSSNSVNYRPIFAMAKTRGTAPSPSRVAQNDKLGSLGFYGYDGSRLHLPVLIEAIVDGTPATDYVPTRLSFVTGSRYGDRAENLVIKSNGNVGINTVLPTSKLQVVGLVIYANNAAAVTGGLTVGAFYRTGADPDPVCVVH